MSLRETCGVIHVPRVRIEEQVRNVLGFIKHNRSMCEEDRQALRKEVAVAQAKLAGTPDAPSIAVTYEEMKRFGWSDFS